MDEMIENENARYKYEQTDGFLSRTDILALYADMLNRTTVERPLFAIRLDGDPIPRNNRPYDCALKVGENPYSLPESKSVSYSIALTAKIPLLKTSEREYAVECIEAVMGVKNGNFYLDNGEYQYFFTQELKLEQAGTPELINGENVGVYRLTGVLNVTQRGGTVLSERVKTFVRVRGADFPILARVTKRQLSATTDNPVQVGSLEPTTQYNAIAYPLALEIVYTDTDICQILRDLIRGELPDELNPFIDGNKLRITIAESYPDGDKLQEYYIVNAEENRQVATYMTLVFSLMKVPREDD